MPRFLGPVLFLLAAAVAAQTPFFPLKDLKPGMKGTGRTVFAGDRIEDFQVEILGVLENIGPRQSLILGRLSGGPLEKAGVMQGMSGSPVYVDGRLAGAVAMAFPFAKEPIAGIRPIEEMRRVAQAEEGRARRRGVSLAETDLTRGIPGPQEALAGGMKMVEIATPVSFGGFTRATLEQFGARLKALGLEPMQGAKAAGGGTGRMGDPASLKPGAMISVQLMTGDMTVGADGTVTQIDGNKVYAFGHRFLSVGSTSLPFARAEVVTLMPILSTSFKISAAKELMGTISQDRNPAVFGELGRRAAQVPLSISVAGGGRRPEAYRIHLVSDRLLTPLLVQMAVFSAIDATERTIGAASYRLQGEIEFEGPVPPIRLNNMFAGDTGSLVQTSLSAAVPLAYVLQSGFENLQVKKIDFQIESFDAKKQLQIEQVWAGRRTVRPGEKVELYTLLAGENGVEFTRKVEYPVPVGARPGPLFFTVADGNVTNLAEYASIIGTAPKSPAQLISTVNHLRTNTKAYVRVWRPEPAFQLEGEDMPAPPPSAALILAGAQTVAQNRNAKVAEIEIGVGNMVITGSKTVQVEVKE